jgi:hypothetical protein
MKILTIILTFFLCIFSSKIFAQTNSKDSLSISKDSSIYVFETTDGNQFTGTIVEEDKEKIIVNTKNFGIINIKKSVLERKYIVEAKNIINNTYIYDNPHATRYFFGPSAFTLKKGEGYYQNIYLLFNQFSYGLSDRFTIGGGIVPTFLFGESSQIPIFLTPKYSFPIKKNFTLGVGVFYANILGSINDNFSDFGAVYGVGTYGSVDKNITVGLGVTFSNKDFSKYPLITISGINRMSKKWSILTENYIIPSDGIAIVGSVLFRYMTQRFAWDFGLARPYYYDDYGDLTAIPMVGATIKFGKY